MVRPGFFWRCGSDFFKCVLVLALLIDLEVCFHVFGIDLKLVGEEERRKADFFCCGVSVLAEDGGLFIEILQMGILGFLCLCFYGSQ